MILKLLSKLDDNLMVGPVGMIARRVGESALLCARWRFVAASVVLLSSALLLCPSVSEAQSTKDSGSLTLEQVIQRREWMTALLDSLELEKQRQKRSGKNIDRLEAFSSAVKDSLAVLRSRISESKPQNGRSNPLKAVGDLGSFNLPSNPFDWLIVGIGAAAILSGLVLVVGLIGSWIRGSKKKRKSDFAPTASEKFTQNRMAPPPPEMPPAPQRPSQAYPKVAPAPEQGLAAFIEEKPIRGRPTDAWPQALQNHSEESFNPSPASEPYRPDTSIRNLRERIGKAQPAKRNEPIPQQPPATRNTRVVPSLDSDQQKANILAASAQGLDSHEIAKRLHVSEDQVALVLRMQSKGSRGT